MIPSNSAPRTIAMVIIAFACFVTSAPCFATVIHNILAATGDPAPTGGNYISLSSPSVDPLGNVAFLSQYSINSTLGTGVFRRDQSGAATIAFIGENSPGGGTIGLLSNPFITTNGSVVFFGGLTGTLTRDVYQSDGNTLTVIAQTGSASPAAGSNYSSLGFPLADVSGNTAFFANLVGTKNAGVFRFNGTTTSAIALNGNAAPSGGNYVGFNNPVVSSNGQVAFNATLSGSTSSRGIFRGNGTQTFAIALSGTSAPSGGNYNTFGVPPAVNSTGQVAFIANLTGGTSTQGIFMGNGTNTTSIAHTG